MQFKATVDETGVIKKATIDGFDISDNLVGFKVEAVTGQPTLVELSLMLVEGELDLAGIKIQGDVDDRSNPSD